MSTTTIPSYLTQEEHLALERKMTIKRKYFNSQIYAWLTPIFLVFAMLIWGSCGSGPFQPVSETEEEEIKVALENRSFRQFDPDDIDASPRKAVILDFFDGVSLWAQYSEGNHAINEWEIFAEDYRVEKAGDDSEIKIYFIEPSSTRTLPTQCENCIETSGVSISIRNVFDSEKISFKLNNPFFSMPSSAWSHTAKSSTLSGRTSGKASSIFVCSVLEALIFMIPRWLSKIPVMPKRMPSVAPQSPSQACVRRNHLRNAPRLHAVGRKM